MYINQQFFSNLLSAASIPAFKVLKAVELPFPTLPLAASLYSLVFIHAATAMYFGTFDVRQCARREEEEDKRHRVQTTEQTTPPPEDQEAVAGFYHPRQKRPHGVHREDQPWGRKYPFLIPESLVTMPDLPDSV